MNNTYIQKISNCMKKWNIFFQTVKNEYVFRNPKRINVVGSRLEMILSSNNWDAKQHSTWIAIMVYEWGKAEHTVCDLLALIGTLLISPRIDFEWPEYPVTGLRPRLRAPVNWLRRQKRITFDLPGPGVLCHSISES